MYGHFARHLSSLYTPASAVSSGMPRFSSWVHIAVITSRLTQPWSPDAYNLPGLGFKGLGLRVQRFAWIVRKAVEVFRGLQPLQRAHIRGFVLLQKMTVLRFAKVAVYFPFFASVSISANLFPAVVNLYTKTLAFAWQSFMKASMMASSKFSRERCVYLSPVGAVRVSRENKESRSSSQGPKP